MGDKADILEEEGAGLAVDGFSETALDDVVLKHLLTLVAVPAVRGRCVAATHVHFSPEEGAARYPRVYRPMRPEAA